MTVHALISTITLLAMAANPLLVRMQPCCCSHRFERTKACCQKASRTSGHDPSRACCGGKTGAPGESGSKPLRGCCCVKAPVSANLVRIDSAKPSLEKQVLDAAWESDDPLPTPTDEDAAAEPEHGATLSGVSLLAHFCVWLK